MRSATSSNSASVSSDEIRQRLNDIIQRDFKEAELLIVQNMSLYSINANIEIPHDAFTVHLPDQNKMPMMNPMYFTPEVLGGLSTVTNAAFPSLDPIMIIRVLFMLIAKKRQYEEEQRQKREEQKRMIEENNRIIEQKMNEIVTHVVEVNRKIRVELAKLEESYMNLVLQLTEEAFVPLFQKLDAEHQEKEDLNAQLQENLAELQQIREQLLQAKCELED